MLSSLTGELNRDFKEHNYIQGSNVKCVQRAV